MSKLSYPPRLDGLRPVADHLWEKGRARGFWVIAIEADPLLVEKASRRFERETEADDLIILNTGVSDREGKFPFWICDDHQEWSSFERVTAIIQYAEIQGW